MLETDDFDTMRRLISEGCDINAKGDYFGVF